MAGTITVDVKGLLPLKQQLELLAMPKALRRRLLSRTARKVISDSKKRVRNQTDLNGQPFVARAKKRKGSRKMLSRLARRLKTVSNTGLEAKIGFFSANDGRVAAKQQHGSVTRVNAKQLAGNKNTASKDAPATRKQAIALRDAGFKVKRAGGKGKKSPSLKWVVANFTVGQAGAILRNLRIEAGEKIKTSWTTVLPARSFLGATAAEVSQHITTIFTQMKQEITHGAR